MKIKPEDQTKLEELLAANTPNGSAKYIAWHKEHVRLGFIKVKSCPATNAFSGILRGDALEFLCRTVYEYANDDHLTTFYKKLYKKYS
jgi:hypothetical protein